MIHETFLAGDVPSEAADAVINRDDIRVEAAYEVIQRVQREMSPQVATSISTRKVEIALSG